MPRIPYNKPGSSPTQSTEMRYVFEHSRIETCCLFRQLNSTQKAQYNFQSSTREGTMPLPQYHPRDQLSKMDPM